MITIEIDPEDETTRILWNQLGELADKLPAGWVLVGGLMVQLHALEHAVPVVRVTKDIDLLGQARPPGRLQALDQSLREEEFKLTGLDLDGYGYRYERDGIIVDLLAPVGTGKPPSLSHGVKAIGIPGGSQALTRRLGYQSGTNYALTSDPRLRISSPVPGLASNPPGQRRPMKKALSV